MITKLIKIGLAFGICSVIFIYNILNSQTTGYALILQGKVIDGTSGKPIGTSLIFISEKGKPSTCKSNAIDGNYQIPLKFGSRYKVMVKGYLPFTNQLTVDLTSYTKYEEVTNDIFVKPMEPKTELFKFKLYEPNDSLIVNKENIQVIKTFMEFNSDVKINIIISSYDSWFSNSKRKVEKIDKKGKKSYKTETYTTKQQLSDLLDSRIVSLRNELKNNNIFLKLDAFIKDLQVVPLAKKQMKRAVPGKPKKTELYTPVFENVKVIIAK